MKKRVLTTTILTALTVGSMSNLYAEDVAKEGLAPQSGVIAAGNVPEREGAFGLNTQWTSVGAPHFMPRSGTGIPYRYANTGYLYPNPSDSSGFYWAQLDLPNGAEVKSVYMPVYDNDSSGHVDLGLYGFQAASPGLVLGDSTPEYKNFGSASSGSTETPGYANISVTPSEPLIIHEYSDFDGDGLGNTFFMIDVYTYRSDAAPDTDIRFFGAAVQWTRTISPAPATASFNDVPTDHWAFQQIEALANSGITTGCDASNFCPDQTVTRAQMAVFLAKALGLHWSI